MKGEDEWVKMKTVPKGEREREVSEKVAVNNGDSSTGPPDRTLGVH